MFVLSSNSEEHLNKQNRTTIRKKAIVSLQFHFYSYYNYTLLPANEARIPKKIHVNLQEKGDRGSLWYRYQLIRYQAPPKLKVLVPPILGEGANN